MRARSSYLYIFVFLVGLTLTACGQSDGQSTPDIEDAGGEDTSPNDDAGDMSTDVSTIDADNVGDMSTTDVGADASDAGTGLTCDEGRINLDGDDSNGCESPEFPAFHDQACQPCWSLPDAIAGCSQGTCQIVACQNDRVDRDGNPMNGCEEPCTVGECLQVGVSVQSDYITIGDITLGRGAATSRWNSTTDTLSYLFPNGVRHVVVPTVKNRIVLDDNRVVGVADDKVKISDDLGLTYYDGVLPQGYLAKFVAQGPNGGVILAGTETDFSLHLLVSDDYVNWTVDREISVQGRRNTFFVTPSSMFIDNFVSTDGGATWTNTAVTVIPQENDVAESVNGTIVMTAREILVSQDKGLTWTPHPFSKPQVVKWIGPDHVIVGGENAIAFSVDNGATWQTQNVEGSVRHFAELENGEVQAFTTTGGIYESVAQGLAWTPSRAGAYVPPSDLIVGAQAVVSSGKGLAAPGQEFTGPWVEQWTYVPTGIWKMDQMGGGVSVLLGADHFDFGNDVTALAPTSLNPVSVPGCAWCSSANLVRQNLTATYNGVTAFSYRSALYRLTVTTMNGTTVNNFGSTEFLRNTGSGWVATAEPSPASDMIPTPLGFLTMDGRYSSDQGVTVQAISAPQNCRPTVSRLTTAFSNGEVLTVTDDVCLGTNGGQSWSSILPVANITNRTGATPFGLAILNVNQTEPVFLLMTHGDEKVLLRSDDRGQTWQELLVLPGNATMSGSGSRMGIVIPRGTTLYYE